MQKSLTFSQVVWPSQTINVAPAKWLARNVALMIGFSALIALTAHFQIRLGFTPVPITGQTFGVLLTGALLGPRLGMATLALYLAEGMLGLPAFASKGTIASYGYLLGYIPAAGIVGYLAERGWDRKPLTSALMMAAGSVIIYVAGVTWLQHFVGGFGKAILLGVLPFLPGDIIKSGLATALLPLGWKWLGKSKANQEIDAS